MVDWLRDNWRLIQMQRPTCHDGDCSTGSADCAKSSVRDAGRYRDAAIRTGKMPMLPADMNGGARRMGRIFNSSAARCCPRKRRKVEKRRAGRSVQSSLRDSRVEAFDIPAMNGWATFDLSLRDAG